MLHDGNDEIIQAGTPGNGDDSVKSDVGIANSHAYTVLGTQELTTEDGTTQRLVKMRNPWGNETYHGPWSDGNQVWTDDLRDEAGHEIKNDGIFFMPVENYHEQVETTFISRDTTGWH